MRYGIGDGDGDEDEINVGENVLKQETRKNHECKITAEAAGRGVHQINFHFLIRLNDNFTNRSQIIQTENKLKVYKSNNASQRKKGKKEKNDCRPSAKGSGKSFFCII